jgi:hypothetical protein
VSIAVDESASILLLKLTVSFANRLSSILAVSAMFSFKSILENVNTEKLNRKDDELIFHYYGQAHSAIRVGDFKLIKFWKTKKLELYNLKDDIGEINDLSKANPEKAKALESRLMAYLESVHAEILYPPTNAKQKSKSKDVDD